MYRLIPSQPLNCPGLKERKGGARKRTSHGQALLQTGCAAKQLTTAFRVQKEHGRYSIQRAVIQEHWIAMAIALAPIDVFNGQQYEPMVRHDSACEDTIARGERSRHKLRYPRPPPRVSAPFIEWTHPLPSEQMRILLLNPLLN
jgi:hypothetical protein